MPYDIGTFIDGDDIVGIEIGDDIWSAMDALMLLQEPISRPSWLKKKSLRSKEHSLKCPYDEDIRYKSSLGDVILENL